MDKYRQRTLNKWLKSQSKLAQRWLIATISFAFLSGLLLIAQAGLLADILHQLIIEKVDKSELVNQFILMLLCIALRALSTWAREVSGYRCGEQIRIYIRQLILDKLRELGPSYIKGKPAGSWASLILEQVEDMQDFFSRYLPQMTLSVLIPFTILVVVFPLNWVAGLIFLITAPLVPLFMALVGMGAADANRRNVKALQRLSGHFYDRLQAMTTIRLFHRAQSETELLHGASEVFRKRTMEVLRLAFLSSAVLEFFTSMSIAIVAVYFGFTFIGELDFGHYGTTVTLFTGLFILILAPEFYQPLRDLGTFYHAKAQAVGAAESILNFLETDIENPHSGNQRIDLSSLVICAKDLEVHSVDNKTLIGPLSFTLTEGESLALVGPSGAGKTTLINALLGFLPYSGSLTVNNIEISSLDLAQWRSNINWVGQNPMLIHGTIKENISLGKQDLTQQQIEQASEQAFAKEFIDELGFDYPISDRSGGLSVGQAQRLALTRAILQQGSLWVLDEPTASLDSNSEVLVMTSLRNVMAGNTTIMITHRIEQLKNSNQIIVLNHGLIEQIGTYDELSQQGLFQSMLNQQMSDGEQHA
ncbi:MAG: cysteine/glutathione ABC transporter permease/ATP-binding protein CydD [Aliivibrio sp.]|uniref:heme ABC transporter permease/ATP-binding protein CydD n=1 Tax=Aliivibrio sp. TaxID=1872443 RepID=UPI001A5D799D|nr:cysteine/glutathione ABC transporter permease/ATP-binding protein CydD [Aliivibrio sp.]